MRMLLEADSIEMIAEASEMIPSVNKNPVASSASWPGVRIVTEIPCSTRVPEGPYCSRISRGSSTATESSVSSRLAAFIFWTGIRAMAGVSVMVEWDIYQIYEKGERGRLLPLNRERGQNHW